MNPFDRVLSDLYVGQKISTLAMGGELARLGVTHVLNLYTLYPGERGDFWYDQHLELPQEDDGSPRDPAQIQSGDHVLRNAPPR